MLVIPKLAVRPRDNAAPRHPSHPATAATAAAPPPPNPLAEPVLITEGQVLLASAIARRTQRPTPGLRSRLTEFWHRLVLAATLAPKLAPNLAPEMEHQPPRRYPPRRLPYFERAAMAREMDRL